MKIELNEDITLDEVLEVLKWYFSDKECFPDWVYEKFKTIEMDIQSIKEELDM
jgi:hypothetical protein